MYPHFDTQHHFCLGPKETSADQTHDQYIEYSKATRMQIIIESVWVSTDVLGGHSVQKLTWQGTTTCRIFTLRQTEEIDPGLQKTHLGLLSFVSMYAFQLLPTPHCESCQNCASIRQHFVPKCSKSQRSLLWRQCPSHKYGSYKWNM